MKTRIHLRWRFGLTIESQISIFTANRCKLHRLDTWWKSRGYEWSIWRLHK